jgi:hypothetical protein
MADITVGIASSHIPLDVPVVPVFINAYYPPNVPSAGRCYALGQVTRGARRRP